MKIPNPVELYIVRRNKQKNALLRRCSDYIEYHSIKDHAFFTRFEAGEYSMMQIRQYALQKSILSKYFPRYIAGIIVKIEKVEVRNYFVKHIYEEHGFCKEEEIHYNQYLDFLTTLGVSSKQISNIETWPCTVGLLNTYKKIAHLDGYLEAFGSFALGCEPVISIEKGLALGCYEKLAERDQLDLNLTYHKEHAKHDLRHTFELADLLLGEISEIHYDSVFYCIKELIDARTAFYNAIAYRFNELDHVKEQKRVK